MNNVEQIITKYLLIQKTKKRQKFGSVYSLSSNDLMPVKVFVYKK